MAEISGSAQRENADRVFGFLRVFPESERGIRYHSRLHVRLRTTVPPSLWSSTDRSHISFLCALPPSLREDWSRHLTALSKPSPSSRLITLMFPLGLPLDGPGPPYPLSEEEYHRLLNENWEAVWGEGVSTERKRRVGGRGEERLVVWRRRA